MSTLGQMLKRTWEGLAERPLVVIPVIAAFNITTAVHHVLTERTPPLSMMEMLMTALNLVGAYFALQAHRRGMGPIRWFLGTSMLPYIFVPAYYIQSRRLQAGRRNGWGMWERAGPILGWGLLGGFFLGVFIAVCFAIAKSPHGALQAAGVGALIGAALSVGAGDRYERTITYDGAGRPVDATPWHFVGQTVSGCAPFLFGATIGAILGTAVYALL